MRCGRWLAAHLMVKKAICRSGEMRLSASSFTSCGLLSPARANSARRAGSVALNISVWRCSPSLLVISCTCVCTRGDRGVQGAERDVSNYGGDDETSISIV